MTTLDIRATVDLLRERHADARGLGPLLADLLETIAEHDDGPCTHVTDCVELIAVAAGPLCTRIATSARMWGVSDEPGPEVTAVRDRDDQLWRRDPRHGWTAADGLGTWRVPWLTVITTNGPLTDATSEVP